ncbi:unnamed protein product [Mycena citricolor]|uniref:Major facilitator superfamily (MFS) profile domain-containing protein n=1 Tax=Mycena citricolor TaxID=2018698 RepID=A0AAD2H7E5_9AGAR|nr:unnamed protein product [Mycena citricolor]
MTSITPASPRKRTPIPKLQLFILLAIQFTEPITALVIYPFIVQFVRDTGITGGNETKTGFYAGLLESSFFLAEGLTVFQFGRLSDIYGRRPLLLLAPLGHGLSMLGFGLSSRFWTLFVFRCFLGAFNGNIGVTKTAMNEISDSTNVADIFAMSPIAWCLGSTMSPFIGGTLVDAAKKWPDTFGKIEYIRNHPYFLPCAVATAISFFVFGIAFVGLKETLPSALRKSRASKTIPSPIPNETDPLLASAPEPTPVDQEGELLPVSQLFTKPVRVALLNIGLLAFCEMSSSALLPLMYATSVDLGGLGLEPNTIGLMMGLAGFSNAIIQMRLGGSVIRYFGARRLFTIAFGAIALNIAIYPLLNFLVRRSGGHIDGWVIMVLVVQQVCPCLIASAYASTMLFVVEASPNPASIGSVNGLAQMASTTFRSVAPSVSSSLFALSIERGWLGGYLVYPVLIFLAMIAARCTLMLPKKLRGET